ncbi:MAG: PAS domain-containing sensor histidine kinase [Verrucomicrobia bacterium]|jgi:PAS domain S-box-containing protein|nr:PAS domain-containing sensor histidine kinase [Verrucomicrobiota bacterium]
MATQKGILTRQALGAKTAVGRHGLLTAREQEKQYRLLFQLNPCPMWICDEKTLEFLAVNEAALRLYGCSRKKFMRMTATDIRPPEDVPKFLRAMGGQRRSRATFVGEWRHVKRDGTVFDVAVTISSIPYAGRAARLVLVDDITERKRAEEQVKQLTATLERRVAERTDELLDANERLRAIMDNALVGILTLNAHGVIESLNPAATLIFGNTPDEMLGRNVSRFMASPQQLKGEEFLAHYLEPGDQRSMGAGREVLGRRKGGHAIVIELTVSDFSHTGRREFVAMVRDITVRKRLERELLEISEREQQRIGRDLHDGLGQQLHGLSYLAALLEKGLQEEASSRAAEAGQLNKYLDEALELTRGLAHGLQPVKAMPRGLMMALRELAERTRAMYRVDCRFECRAPVLIHRHTAATHLYRIAQEAVNNAMKHAKPTRVRIKLAATAQRIVLGVRDNGTGIRHRKAPARGMGLHIMQYRADAIRGTLAVQKLPERGTEVVCTVKRLALLPQENHTQ